MSVARTWGTTAAERARPLPCERHVDADDVYDRAVDVEAPPDGVFRWLCQLRAAPYSYDWIDNLGRRSPQQLTPGLERLAVGQRFMTIFDLVEFEPDRQITLRVERWQRFFGHTAVTYLVEARGEGRSRLFLRICLQWSGGRLGRELWSRAMPWPELVMSRRQLLNIKGLAEAQANHAESG